MIRLCISLHETEAMENVSGLVKGEKFFSNKIVSDHVTLSIKGDRIYHMSVNKLLQTLHITDYK